jgi:hypothetical protein
MSDLFGLSLAVMLVIVGIVVLVAATVIHWILLIVGVAIIGFGLYLLLTGGLGPL